MTADPSGPEQTSLRTEPSENAMGDDAGQGLRIVAVASELWPSPLNNTTPLSTSTIRKSQRYAADLLAHGSFPLLHFAYDNGLSTTSFPTFKTSASSPYCSRTTCSLNTSSSLARSTILMSKSNK